MTSRLIKFIAQLMLMAGLLWFLLTVWTTQPLAGAGSGPWWW